MYSNFGYCILGRVIEKITGKTYIESIRDEFKVDVRVAGDTSDDLLDTESYYYDSDQNSCFTMPLARMDSCAGLIISPLELVNFSNQLTEDVH